MSDPKTNQGNNQPTQQQTTQPPQEGKPTTDYSLGRRYVGNSADKIRKKNNPQ